VEKNRFDTYPDIKGIQPSGVTNRQFKDALDPLNTNYDPSKPESPDNIYSLTKRVKEYQDIVNTLGAQLPLPVLTEDTAQEAFKKGIEKFTKGKIKSGDLEKDRRLKPVATPRFRKACDPVILINGALNTESINSNEVLHCRLDSQVISSVTVNGDTLTAKKLAGKIPGINSSKLPGPIPGLVVECYFIDPDNAESMVSALPSMKASDLKTILQKHSPENYGAYLPDFNLVQWQQPWEPLFIDWEVYWYSINYMASDGKTKNWTFDGNEYHFTGPLPDENFLKSKSVSGRTFLTPQTSFLFQDRLEKFFQDNPDAGMTNYLKELKNYLDNWDFICQSLDGFNDMLAMQDSSANRTPSPDDVCTFSDGSKKKLLDLMGDHCHSRAYLPPTDDTFQPFRQGQAFVHKLIVYDRFGQVVEVVGDSGLKSSDDFRPILAEGLSPDQCLYEKNKFRFIQLPPRLLQYCRVDLRFVDNRDPNMFIDDNSTANPVCAWLLPNHIDQGISLFDNQGASLGELRLIETGQATRKVVRWQPSPLSIYQSIDDLKAVSPQLAAMIDSLYKKGENAFRQFLEVIDATLWTIDPVGSRENQNLSALIGRPLALVRTQLRFKLDGPPIQDSSWEATFNTEPPEFITRQFDIRLGDPEIRQDGLIGYYYLDGNDDYTVFHSTHKLENLQPDSYIHPIALGNFIRLDFQEKSKADVLMLVDPRASVHAFTGILPVKVLELPDRFISPVLKQIEVSFHMGPFLTHVEEDKNKPGNDGDASTRHIAFPYPAEKNGTWSWWESQYANEKEIWKSCKLAKVDQKAHLKNTQNTIREGFLHLSIDVEK